MSKLVHIVRAYTFIQVDCNMAIMYFSGDVSHNPTNDFRDRIVTELDQNSVETVSQ